MRKLTIFLVGLFAFGSTLAQTQVPNTFQPGQPARAAEVNANFDALEAAIDENAGSISQNSTNISSNSASISDNAANIASNSTDIQQILSSIGGNGAVRWLANGQAVGSFLGMTELLTPFDFYVHFDLATGRVEAPSEYLFYLSPDCAGQAYMPTFAPTAAQGAVVRSPWDGDAVRLYYRAHGTVVVESMTFASNLFSLSGCQNGTSTGVDAVPVFPNDPAVTGVSSEFFDLPMTLGHQ